MKTKHLPTQVLAAALSEAEAGGFPVRPEPGELGTVLSYEPDWEKIAATVLLVLAQHDGFRSDLMTVIDCNEDSPVAGVIEYLMPDGS